MELVGASGFELGSGEDDTATPSLAGLLPLKVSGRHYGENLARVDVLFSSLLEYAAPGSLDDLIIVTPQAEVRLVAEYADAWPELPLRIVDESEYFQSFCRFTRPWQIRPWQRQQIIKLNAPALTRADYVLTLDPDVIMLRRATRQSLLPGGRALLQPEPRTVHPQHWRDSAALLNLPLDFAAPGMTLTPALVSRDILIAIHNRLEDLNGRPWMDVLLTSYCNWTEYTLYLLMAESSGLLDRRHRWCVEGDDHELTPLQVAPENSIWDRRTATVQHLEMLLSGSDPGIFGVVQSNTRMDPGLLKGVVTQHFPVRSPIPPNTPVPVAPSKLSERTNTLARLAASRVYRARRWLRERTDRRH